MTANKKTFILVHGAWHASWCWQYVAPLLVAAGHTVLTPDLPGHGSNQTQDLQNITLATYVNFLVELVKQQNQPVILVGHSLAGVIIAEVAERIPESIEQLIFIAAFIPQNKKSLLQEAAKSAGPGLSTELVIDEAKNEIAIKKTAKVRDFLFHDCSAEDADLAMSLLQTQPFRPMADGVSLSAARFGKVKKRFIECVTDKPLSLADQRRMHSQWEGEVISLQSGHSPFFSVVDDLVAAIVL